MKSVSHVPPSKSALQMTDNYLPITKHCSTDSRLLIFELAYLGHYPSYIYSLARYWCHHKLPGHLDILVSPSFKKHHSDVMEIASAFGHKNLKFVVITEAEQATLTPRNSPLERARRSLQEWCLLQKYAKALHASHCILLYFDSFQTSVASGQKLSCPFSGIYFRPTFHYNTFPGHKPSPKERIQHWRERMILPRIMHHPKLANLFCLDPYAVPHINRFGGSGHVKYLPDPVEMTSIAEKAIAPFKQGLGIEPNRTVFLLFGALYDPRKGLTQVLDAIKRLPAQLSGQVCLLLVGTLGDNALISDRINDLQSKSPAQIVLHNTFIPSEDIPLYFRSSDVILATYQCHVGMSGILVQAAAAQKPLLSSAYGLMGETTRNWQLGLTIDATSPKEIEVGMTHFLTETPEKVGDRTKMQAFAVQNSSDNFAHVIFQSVLNYRFDNSIGIVDR